MQEVFLEPGQVLVLVVLVVVVVVMVIVVVVMMVVMVVVVEQALAAMAQVLWYEGALLPHGRPAPFQGEHYDNIFLHFKPKARGWYRCTCTCT